MGQSGWEVYRRRFSTLGGKLIAAVPLELRGKAPLLWELRVRDSIGVRVLEVAWVVSAGPFSRSEGLREFPPGSCLFEMEQSGGGSLFEDPQGWALEEERGRLLAVRVIKALGNAPREQLEELQRRARNRLKRALKHLEQPMSWTHEGKWSSRALMQQVRAFSGVPRQEHQTRAVASIECIEEIECRLCEASCPENAISISRSQGTFLNELACTGCAKCITACPAQIPVLIHEKEHQSSVQVTLAHPAGVSFKDRDLAQVVNRQGAQLGAAKVIQSSREEGWLKLEMPAHLAWEARGVRRSYSGIEDEWVLKAERTAASKVEVQLQGEKRMLRTGQSLALALFETGYARSGDRLLCRDGSCRRCEIRVDGVKKLACRTQVHRGMSIQLIDRAGESQSDSELLCPCSSVHVPEVLQKIREGRLNSPESIRQACGLGEGSCRGRSCLSAFRRLLEKENIDCSDWIDWRFPWADWTLSI
jgi:Fe-S-cluster-containing hydrogenase component 2